MVGSATFRRRRAAAEDDGRNDLAGDAQGPHPLRRRGLLPLSPQGVHQGDGLLRRRTRPPHRRHRGHRQRLQRLPRQRPAARRGCEAGGDARRRTADGLPHHLPSRVVLAPHQHVPPQPHGDGHRGDGAGPADGRGGPHRRLRQDHSRSAHGRRERGRARPRPFHRPDDDRALARRAARGVHRLPPFLGHVPGG